MWVQSDPSLGSLGSSMWSETHEGSAGPDSSIERLPVGSGLERTGDMEAQRWESTGHPSGSPWRGAGGGENKAGGALVAKMRH